MTLIFTGGPYHICTAQLIPKPSKIEERTRLYWMIDWKSSTSETSPSNDSGNESDQDDFFHNRFNMVSTADDTKASNFYFKPIIESSNDKHFWIVTDPEDHGVRKQPAEQKDDKEHSERCLEQKQPRSYMYMQTKNNWR